MSELLTLIGELEWIEEELRADPAHLRNSYTLRARVQLATIINRLRAEAAAIDAETTREAKANGCV